MVDTTAQDSVQQSEIVAGGQKKKNGKTVKEITFCFINKNLQQNKYCTPTLNVCYT